LIVCATVNYIFAGTGSGSRYLVRVVGSSFVWPVTAYDGAATSSVPSRLAATMYGNVDFVILISECM
jgi:hypothetical protein